jgi:hypothetical protein
MPKMSLPGHLEQRELPQDHEFDDHEWKRVKYIKIVPRKFKENLELKFKDIVKTGNTLKKVLEDRELAKKEALLQ